MKTMIEAKKVHKSNLNLIYNMLQGISSYTPDKNLINSIWGKFKSQKNLHAFSFYDKGKLMGYGSVLIENKIRGGKSGHIEDIVVGELYRGSGYGKQIINHLIGVCKDEGCYKISLCCKEPNVDFYNSCGFEKGGITMRYLLNS